MLNVRCSSFHLLARVAAALDLDLAEIAADDYIRLERREKVVSTLTGGVSGLFKKNGIELIEGDARLAGPNQVVVGESPVEARTIILATGSVKRSIPGTEFALKADLMLLAMGFVHPVHEGMIKTLGLALDPRGNVKADTLAYRSSNPKVFACGDMRRGQSLVVWAIREGRQCAHAVDKQLMGMTALPR